MQKYQFWKTSYTQNIFFVHIETTENTFFLQKKVFFHAEHLTVYFTSAGHFENCGISFIRKMLDTKSINHLCWHNMESLFINIDHQIT